MIQKRSPQCQAGSGCPNPARLTVDGVDSCTHCAQRSVDALRAEELRAETREHVCGYSVMCTNRATVRLAMPWGETDACAPCAELYNRLRATGVTDAELTSLLAPIGWEKEAHHG